MNGPVLTTYYNKSSTSAFEMADTLIRQLQERVRELENELDLMKQKVSILAFRS
jgi:hypothetical protein